MLTGPKVPLTSELHRLAARFADDLLAAFAAQRLDDVLSAFARARRGALDVGPATRRAVPTSSSPSTPQRRPSSAPSETRAVVLARVVAAVSGSTGGVRAEELRQQTGLAKSAFAQAVRNGLATGELRKEGALRATRYFPAT